MKKAFTLIELLVVIGIIALLLAIILPGLRYAREMGRETVCRSNLRQLAIILNTYTGVNASHFPDPSHIYHSSESFDRSKWGAYYRCCRWHDERMGFDSPLLRENPELRGSLWPYLGTKEIMRCKVGRRANDERGCYNSCLLCRHDGTIPVVAQYTYTMNAYLGSTITTGGTGTESGGVGLNIRTLRKVSVRKTSQVTRNPAEVFVFGEQNSWAMNPEGIQPLGPPHWSAKYELSGRKASNSYHPGTLRLADLEIASTRRIVRGSLRHDRDYIGHAFATCHRPQSGDLNTGHSYVSMLDGHVEKVTVVDQVRQSRRPPGVEESRLGPGGNLALAWPLDVAPPGGWENQ